MSLALTFMRMWMAHVPPACHTYGLWIIHASGFGQDESAATPCGKALWARPWTFCIVHWGCVPRGRGPKNLGLHVKVPSRVSVGFHVNPAWVSRASTPCGKELCG